MVYFAIEIVVSCDVGPEVFEGRSIEVSGFVLTIVFDSVKSIVIKVIVDQMTKPPHNKLIKAQISN